MEHKDPHCTELRTPSEEKHLVKQRNYALSMTYSPEGRLSPEKCISITPGMDALHLYLCPPIKSVVKIDFSISEDSFFFFFSISGLFAHRLDINTIEFFWVGAKLTNSWRFCSTHFAARSWHCCFLQHPSGVGCPTEDLQQERIIKKSRFVTDVAASLSPKPAVERECRAPQPL